jgi:anti-sigma factor RsiW
VSCQEQSDERLWESIDGELTPAEQASVARHLADCRACAARLEALRARPLALGRQRMVAPPPDFHRRVMARVAAEAARSVALVGAPWLPGTARHLPAVMAASLTLAFLCVAVVGAALAGAVIAAAAPAPTVPFANDLAAALRGALQPIGRFFHEWGWFIVIVGMVAVVVVAITGALTRHTHGRA